MCIVTLVLAAMIVSAGAMAGKFLPAMLTAAVFLFIAGNLLGERSGQLCVTLTATNILQLNLEAFKTLVPILPRFSTDFSSGLAVKDESIIAHVLSVPTVQDYDATNGFKVNAANAEDLMTDVTVSMSRLRHTPIKVDYLTAHTSKKNLHLAAAESGYALGKDIVDYVLSLVTAANVTNATVRSAANSNLDTLETIRTAMNNKKAPVSGRVGIVNSAVAQTLATDSRVASRDYYGQLNGAAGYRVFLNIAGFDAVYEYPDVPANSINLSGFFTARTGVIIAARTPNIAQNQAAALGIPQIGKFESLQDPTTGMTFLSIAWQEPSTFDNYLTIAELYGARVGAQGGGADAVTDRSTHRLVTS